MTPPRPPGHPLLLSLVLLGLVAPARGGANPVQALEQTAMEHLAAVQTAGGEPILPFTTDGCSGGLSAAWQGAARLFPGFTDSLGDAPPWESCCVAHDRAYWRGGAEDGYALRLAADAELRRCVVATGVERGAEFAARLDVSERRVADFIEVVGELMHAAVRTGGGPCTGLPWRWGYGWPHCMPGAGAAP